MGLFLTVEGPDGAGKTTQIELLRDYLSDKGYDIIAVSYTHLRAHETDSYLVCRLLLEKKKTKNNN